MFSANGATSVRPMRLTLAVIEDRPKCPVLPERVPAVGRSSAKLFSYLERLFLRRSLLTHRLLNTPASADRELRRKLIRALVLLRSAHSAVHIA